MSYPAACDYYSPWPIHLRTVHACVDDLRAQRAGRGARSRIIHSLSLAAVHHGAMPNPIPMTVTVPHGQPRHSHYSRWPCVRPAASDRHSASVATVTGPCPYHARVPASLAGQHTTHQNWYTGSQALFGLCCHLYGITLPSQPHVASYPKPHHACMIVMQDQRAREGTDGLTQCTRDYRHEATPTPCVSTFLVGWATYHDNPLAEALSGLGS